jgi:hypothetical protein
MGPWTLRLACLLIATALIAGCGSSSSSSSTTASRAPIRTTRPIVPPHRAKGRIAARSSSYPASVVSAFNRNCAQFVRRQASHYPGQYQGLLPTAINVYCSCALGEIEASVGVNQFKHDVIAIVFRHTRPPAYVAQAEQNCGGQLQQTLSQATAG